MNAFYTALWFVGHPGELYILQTASLASIPKQNKQNKSFELYLKLKFAKYWLLAAVVQSVS
jgi:hypothetical protein